MSVKAWGVAAVVAAGLTLVAAQLASGQASSSTGQESTSQRVAGAIDSGRVATLEQVGTTAVATGRANGADQSDMVRTEWFETLAAAALAQSEGLTTVRRVVLNESGSKIYTETDPFSSEQTSSALAAPTLTEADIRTALETQAQAAGVAIVDVNYSELFGGAAELVLQPTDVERTLGSASTVTHDLLGALAADQHPYLITIVDSQGVVQMLQGYVPGVGGDKGQGIAWLATGAHTDNLYGAPVAAEPAS